MFKYTCHQALQRLTSCGISRNLSLQLLREIDKWRLSNGEEWTIQRLKFIRLEFLRKLAGLSPSNEVWIKRHSDGRPKGPFGNLWKFSPKRVQQVWAVLSIYTGFVYEDPEYRATPKQLEKFELSVKRKPVDEQALNQALSLLASARFPLMEFDSSQSGTPMLAIPIPEEKRAPRVLFGWKNAPAPQTILDSINALARFPKFLRKHRRILNGTIKGLENVLEDFLAHRDISGDEYGVSDTTPSPFDQFYDQTWYQDRNREGNESFISGNISFIQEGGYKLRHVAVPHVVCQAALRPLGDALFRYLWKIPEDASSIEDRRIPEIQEWLKASKRCYCYDLSAATDNFPLDLQIRTLEFLGVSSEWIALFKDIAQGNWWLPPNLPPRLTGGKRDELMTRWEFGQPLGLYPSFALFSITHHLLLSAISRSFGHDHPYRVLGDDVIISNDNVAAEYERLMVRLGVPISESKSIVSDRVAEFAGALILPDRVCWSFKWKGPANDHSFVDIARNLGPASVASFRPRQRAVLEMISSIPEPWGCGWNPKGLPLEDRMGPTWEKLFFSKDTRPLSYAPRSRRIWYAIYGNQRYASFTVVSPDAASDQDAADLVVRVLGPRWKVQWLYVLPNIDFIVHNKDLSGGLLLARDWSEVDDVLSRHLMVINLNSNASTLHVLERKLGIKP